MTTPINRCRKRERSGSTSRMSKKKQQKNGFFIFMMDMQQELRESGRSVPMRDMPVLAGPNWSKLTDGQKMAYNQRAKQGKVGKMPGAVGPGQSLATPLPRPGKMDSQGVLLSVSLDTWAALGRALCHRMRRGA